MPLTTATNPQTKETAVLVDNQWHKVEQQATNDKGHTAYLAGGKWHIDDTPVVPKNITNDFEGDSNMGPSPEKPADYLTGAANVLTGMAGGVFGAGAAATTPLGKDYLWRASERAGDASKAFTEQFRPFSSEASQRGEEQIGEGLDWAIQKGGAGVNWLSKKQLELEGVKLDPKTEMMREAVTRGTGEVASQFVPLERGIQAARGIGRPKPPILTPEQIANQQIITKAQQRAASQGRTEVTPDDIRAVTKHEYQGGVDYPGPDVVDMHQQPPKQLPLEGMQGVDLDYPQMEKQGALDLQPRAPEPQSPLTTEPQQLKLPFDRTELDNTFSTPGFNRSAEQVMQAREFGNKEMEPPIYDKAQARPDELGAVKEPSKATENLSNLLSDPFKAYEAGLNPKWITSFPKLMEFVRENPEILHALLDQAAYYKREEGLHKAGGDKAVGSWLWDEHVENKGTNAEGTSEFGYVRTPLEKAVRQWLDKNIATPKMKTWVAAIEEMKALKDDASTAASLKSIKEDLHGIVQLFDKPRDRIETALHGLAESLLNTKSPKQPKGTLNAASKKVAEAFGEKEVVINNEEFNKTLADRTEKGDFRGALEHIMSSSGNPFYRWLADTLLLDPKFSPKLVVYDSLPGKDGMMMAGQWQVGGKTVALAREGGWHGSEMIMLHEAVHARVAELQWRYNSGLSVPKSVKSNIEAIDKLYYYVRENLPEELKDDYAMSDSYEFLTHGLTDKYFQEILQDIQLPKDVFFEKRKEGVFSAFKGFMHYLLGVLKNMGFGKFDLSAPNALAVFLNESAAALREIGYNPAVAKVAYGPEGLEWANKIGADLGAMPWVKKAQKVEPESKGEYRKKLEEREGKAFADRWGDALHDEYMKQWKKDNAPSAPQVGYDNRGHDDFKKEDLFRKDGSRRIDDTGYIFPAGPAYTAAEAHPVIRRVYDQVSQAGINKDNLFNKWFRKAEIVDRTWNPIFGRVTAMQTKAKVDHPDSLSILMEKMSDKEWGTALELKNRYSAQHPDYLSDATMLRANGATPKVVKFFNELESVTKTVLGEINKARALRGKEEIPYKPGWMWSQAREGAYQVFSHDANARHTYLAGFNNFADAEKVASYLRKEKGMDITADMADHNPRSVDILPSDAFFEAAGMLEDPRARKLVMDAAEEAIKRLGINKYALTRDSKIGGFAGSKELIDSLGVGKAAEGVRGSIEKYLQRAANYVGSADASKRVGELLLDYDIQKNYPHATAKARYMWEQYQGVPRGMDELFRIVSKGLSTLPGLKQLGFNDKTLENTTSFAGQAFTVTQLVWLNPTFYIANALQNFVVPSRMQQLKSTVLGDKGNITEALLKAELHMAVPTETSKAIWHKALDNGSLQAKFVEALDWSRAPAAEAVKMAMGENVAAFADSYSRGKAYVSFYELARSAGYDDAKAHSFAARESQGTMVQYERWARMPILNKLGPVGDAVAPLTGFVTNMAFRLGDYAAHAVKGKEGTRLVAPIMTLLGLQVALAGIKGSPFYTDLEDMYMSLNTHFVKQYGTTPWKTPSQLMADAGIPSWLQYGIPSALTDANMSGTLGMGQVAGNMGQMVGYEYMANAIKAFYSIAQQMMVGNQTKQDTFDNVNKMMPPMAKEWLRSILDGQSPLTPAKVQQGEGLTYQRNQREQVSALLTGRAPLKESETKIAKHHGTQIESATKDAKTQARDVLVDNVIAGAALSPFVMRVLMEYPDEMLDGIDKDIEHRVLALNIPHEDRMMIKHKTNQRLLQLWQDVYRNKNENFK